jgi:hypothetical protein
MIKAYLCVNQFNDLKHIYTKPELHLRLRDTAKACRTYQQLDEKVVELQFDLTKEQMLEIPKDKRLDDLEPGFYRHDHGGFYTFRGDPMLVKEIRTVAKSNIDDPTIPRLTMVAVVDDKDILKNEYWWNSNDLANLVARYKPKFMCRGYLHSIIGEDKVRIDYVPVSIDERVLTQVVKDLIEGLSRVGDQLEGVFLDHGTNQEIDLLDL